MCMFFCTLSTAEMALPSAAFGPRLNDTVMAGNWPWCVMASGSVVFSKCAKALRGTALLVAELVAPAEPAPLLDVAVEVLAESAFAGGVSVGVDGVYNAEVVSEFDPAEDEPEDAKDEDAPAPVAPEDALDWI